MEINASHQRVEVEVHMLKVYIVAHHFDRIC